MEKAGHLRASLCLLRGAVSLLRVQAAIGVDEAAVKTALRHVCAQDKDVRCVECLDSCEILTGAYISTLAHEAENTARERGRITFAELSSNFRLPIHVSMRRGSCQFDTLQFIVMPACRTCTTGTYIAVSQWYVLRQCHVPVSSAKFPQRPPFALSISYMRVRMCNGSQYV